MDVRIGDPMSKRTKFHPRRRDGDQLPTVPVTILEIMSRRAFARGVADARAGRGYPSNYDTWKETNDMWAYERGRQWARLAPRNLPLMINGKLNPLALQQYGDGIV